MAFNPYTEQSASGYNSSPPADDGTAAAANRVKYATVKDKLGDPVKNLADSIDDAVNTAFGKLTLNGRTAKTTTYTVTTGDYGKVVACTGTFTVTLPAAATADSGFHVWIENVSTGLITVDGDGSETINAKTTVAIGHGQSCIVQSDGSNWSAYWFNSQQSVALICDQKAQNTAGGTFTSGADRARDINFEISDPHGIVSISSNQFILATVPASYLFEWSAPARIVDRHQTLLYDITGTAELTRGSSEMCDAANGVLTRSFGSFVHTITASNTYEIRHRCQTTRATDGFGLEANFGVERYTMVKISRIG